MSIVTKIKNKLMNRDFVDPGDPGFGSKESLHLKSFASNKIEPILTVQNISLKFPEMERHVLQDITLTLYPGDCLILLGSNGSGKSTLMKLIQGIHTKTSGNISILQAKSARLKNRDLAKNLIALTQDLRSSLFFDFTVLENCLLWNLRQGGSLFQMRTQKERAFFAQYLKEFHPRLTEKLDTPLCSLSGGEKQALLLGLCLLHPPQLLLLDEHTSALDSHQTDVIMSLTMQYIAKHQVTSIICTHNLDHALKYGNRLIVMQDGKIILNADKTLKQTLARPKLLELLIPS